MALKRINKVRVQELTAGPAAEPRFDVVEKFSKREKCSTKVCVCVNVLSRCNSNVGALESQTAPLLPSAAAPVC